MLRTKIKAYRPTKRSLFTMVAVAIAAALGLGAGAVAATTSHGGSTYTNYRAVTENSAWSAAPAANTFVPVPNAAISTYVPSGTNRMLDVSYTAESQCGGTSGWCSVRAVLIRPGGVVEELRPVVGTDFAFDSPDASGSDPWESHAINRQSYYLSPGSYTVRIEAARVAGATSIRLDDWSLVVRQVAP